MNHVVQTWCLGLALLTGFAGGGVGKVQAEATPTQKYVQTLQLALEKTRTLAWPEAAPLWQQLVTANPTLGSHWLALALARFYQGDDAGAIAAFTKARELGSFPDYQLMELAFTLPPDVLHDFEVASWPWGTEYFLACCYARRNDKTEALTWLDRALKSGLRDRVGLLTDPRFASLRQDPHFHALVGVNDTKTLSRTEGWRTDLRLLGEEVTRLHFAPNRQAAEPLLKKQLATLTREVPHLSDAQIAVRIMQALTLLKSGHTTLPWWDSRSRLGGDVPVKFYLFPEGVFITSATSDYRDLVGAHVVAVGDHPVTKILESLTACISHDNALWPMHIAPILLRKPVLLHALDLTPSPETLPLTVKLASGERKQVALSPLSGEPQTADKWVTVTAVQGKPQPLSARESGPYWYEYLPESHTLYVQYSAVDFDPKDPFDAFCKRLFDFITTHDVQKFVLDLRRNSGGNSFLLSPLITGMIGCEKINQRGKLFVITGRATFSAAMNCATYLERYTHATFVGEPTGSSPNFVGETVIVPLPYSKLPVSLSDLYWQSSWPMDHRTWIPPLLYAPPTFAAYREGRDLALEAILAYPAP